MFIRVWQYDVRPDARAEFERVYGSAGEWAALFALADGFIGTDLFRSVDEPMRYVTVDRFTDAAAWDRFLAAHADAYRDLDERCSSLTVVETALTLA